MTELTTKINTESYTPVTDQAGGISPTERKHIFGKLKDLNKVLVAVVVVLVVAVITMLFMVAGFLLDAWHFNSATYKECSEKTASVETTQKANEVLLKQIQDLLEQSKQDRETVKQLLKK